MVVPLESGAQTGHGRSCLSIAIVTDDNDLAEACARVLRAQGHRVRVARHGGHAHLLCLSGEHVDVLLIERLMPDGSSPGVVRRMRRHNPGLHCIHLATAGSACGEEGVLVRPFTADDLLGRLPADLDSALASSP